MSETATPRQLEVLAFIETEVAARGLPPTIREIGAHFGWRSVNAARDNLVALERKGLLARGTGPEGIATRRALRSLRVPAPPAASAADGLLELHVYVPTTTGALVQPANLVDTLRVGRSFAADHDVVLGYRVRDDAMRGAGICQGDTVLWTPAPWRDGALVLVDVGGGAILRRCAVAGAQLQLHAADAPRSPMIAVRREDAPVVVIGVAIGLWRAPIVAYQHASLTVDPR